MKSDSLKRGFHVKSLNLYSCKDNGRYCLIIDVAYGSHSSNYKETVDLNMSWGPEKGTSI